MALYFFDKRRPTVETNQFTVDTHHKRATGLARMTAIVCSISAGIGIAIGLQEPQEGVLLGIIVPSIVGILIAVGIALAWHNLISVGARASTRMAILGVIAGGLGLTAIAVAASTWAVATMLGGTAALRHHASETILQFDRALNQAWQNVAVQRPVIDEVHKARAQVEAMAEIEIKHGSGANPKPGAGRRSEILIAAAQQYDALARRVHAEFDDQEKIRTRGRALLKAMATQMNGVTEKSYETFAQISADLRAIVTALATADLTRFVGSQGVLLVEFGINKEGARLLRTSLDKVSQALVQRAKEIGELRQEVEAPTFAQMGRREATLAYMDRVPGAWVTAVGIEILPVIMLFVVLATSVDPGIRDTILPEAKLGYAETQAYDPTYQSPTTTAVVPTQREADASSPPRDDSTDMNDPSDDRVVSVQRNQTARSSSQQAAS